VGGSTEDEEGGAGGLADAIGAVLVAEVTVDGGVVVGGSGALVVEIAGLSVICAVDEVCDMLCLSLVDGGANERSTYRQPGLLCTPHNFARSSKIFRKIYFLY
jgi:hypothetical protein